LEIEKDTDPAFESDELPLGVPTLSHDDPAITEAVQFTVPPAAVTRNDPFGFAGDPPTCMLYDAPEVPTPMLAVCNTWNETCVDAVPAELTISTCE
jgi:hypothetical protein